MTKLSPINHTDILELELAVQYLKNAETMDEVKTALLKLDSEINFMFREAFHG